MKCKYTKVLNTNSQKKFNTNTFNVKYKVTKTYVIALTPLDIMRDIECVGAE